MSTFIQLHLLTSFPPANLNRDDMGRPKTAKMGGVDRLRISSQSLKRAWRTSDLFQSAMKGNIGIRTKELGKGIHDYLFGKGIKEKDAREWARQIAGVFGDLKENRKEETKADGKNVDADSDDGLKIEQLVHVSPEEKEAVDSLAAILAAQKRAPKKEELDLLRHSKRAVDIALFGRMLASKPSYNVEAACQVAHAISVHPVVIEDDYFTAVDDLNTGEIDRGAAHIGETGFASALFYLYVCINRDLLVENLDSDTALANKTLAALVETVLKVPPEGKQNSFASRAYASYALVEKGDIQPRSLSVAFLKPIRGDNFGEDAYKALEKCCDQIDKVYEIKDIRREKLNTWTGEGGLSNLITFVQG
jgi:CRISPR system Cascade subunit CasC